MHREDVAGALEGVRNLIQPDGGDFELVSVDGATGQVRIRLLLSDANCAACILPRPALESVALAVLGRRLPAVKSVIVDDPRIESQTRDMP
ncbi:NifU family protein [Frankia sp. AgB1.9]|uniref:NifU family protein n=1 Tax=unclassified Frankia TaxID=2632575 RepID=UPI00193340E3|nr:MULTISPECIES: NifU family protein [unclassified Frankia]MBL7491429.1 NifU family protein [Frankia sp. AgW1.1]MBL7553778.1 NifU family protein [Frankia sp. AgB1.9]MBL7620961.1 NifU family protein [Frankia sp. AgB1.8]